VADGRAGDVGDVVVYSSNGDGKLGAMLIEGTGATTGATGSSFLSISWEMAIDKNAAKTIIISPNLVSRCFHHGTLGSGGVAGSTGVAI